MEPVRQIAERLSRSLAVVVTAGFPFPTHRRVERWIGPRVFVWPDGIPSGRLIAPISSRLGRRWDRQPSWFAALRHVGARLRRDSVLLSAPSTTTGETVEAAAQLWNLPSLRLTVPRDRMSLERWIGRVAEAVHRGPAAGAMHYRAFGSPPLLPGGDRELAGTAVADRAVVAAAAERIVLAARRGGNIHRLSLRILSESGRADRTRVVDGAPELVSAPVARELVRHGAQPFPVRADRPGRPLDDGTASPPRSAIVEPPSSDPWPYLSHWTRAAPGAWPHESPDDFWRALLCGSPAADRSALAALQRIIAMRRLVASPAAIRGGTPVVCFSAVPVTGSAWRRQFRPHRRRWDFESYGLSIRREWLERRGVRPVRYGTRDQWNALPAEDRPFFQSAEARGDIDWTIEREFRIVGDVPLDVGPRDALVFCPSHADAVRLAATSPWPVFVAPRHD